MQTKFMEWARTVFLAGTALALVFIIPTQWFPLQLAKVGVFAVALLLSILLYVYARGFRSWSTDKGIIPALLVALLPLAYGVATFFSVDPALALIGYATETDTIVFVGLGALTFFFASVLFTEHRSVRRFLAVLAGSLVVAAVFQWIAIVFGTNVLPFQAFADRSVNLVGKWNDLGLLLGLLTLMITVWAEFFSLTRMRTIVLGLVVGALLVLLGVINFVLVWWLLAVLAGVVAGFRFVTNTFGEGVHAGGRNWKQIVPWFAGAVVFVSILFILYGTSLSSRLTSVFPVSSLEVRPGYTATMEVVTAARDNSMLRTVFGTGPDTFGQQWLLHKPAGVNDSQFWNLDFSVGFSVVVTALGSVGLVGAFAWLIPLLLILIALVRAMRVHGLSREEQVTVITLAFATLFLWGSVIFYVPSQNIILLAFAVGGAAFGYLYRAGRAHSEGAVGTSHSMLVYTAVAGVLAVTTLGMTGLIVRNVVVEGMVQQGSALLASGDVAGALALADRAVGIDSGNIDARLLAVGAGANKLQQIANTTEGKPEDLRAQFQDQLQKTIAHGQAAATQNPRDYRPFLSLAQLYTLLAGANIDGAHAGAENMFAAAVERNPKNPGIFLALARLEALKGNKELTERFLAQSLTLKQNYTDAILMVVQLNIDNKDIANAIRAAEAAVQTAPGVASIWFQLGLLHYSANNMKEAIAPLEQAVSLAPEYANAKYFLSLAYYAQGKKAEGIALMQALATANPDNKEVPAILQNMQAGKPAFDGLEQAAASEPEKRTTAPLSE